MYSVRVLGTTTTAPRMLELECLDSSVYVNAVLSFCKAGVEEGNMEGEYGWGEEEVCREVPRGRLGRQGPG